MPRAAVEIAAELILPLNRIAFALTVLAGHPSATAAAPGRLVPSPQRRLRSRGRNSLPAS